MKRRSCMTAQGIVLNLSQISFQIRAQQASSEPGYKVSNGGKLSENAEWHVFFLVLLS